MFQVVPTIGTILALIAFFFAAYFRTIQKNYQLGIDSVKSVGELPSKSRLDATKILINVFDLDVKTLTIDQQFELAKRTFEKREVDSRRNFLILICSGVFFLLCAVLYFLFQFDGGGSVKAALLLDRESTISALNGEGFYSSTDPGLVQSLAKSAKVDRNITDPFDRVEKFSLQISKEPNVAELRELAAQEKAPFEIAGDILNVSVPTRPDQPPRYIAYVKRKSPLAGRVITLSVKGRMNTLQLVARDYIINASPSDLQLNYEQFKELFGLEPDYRRALVIPASSQRVYDPTCPRYEGFPVITCDQKSELPIEQIASK